MTSIGIVATDQVLTITDKPTIAAGDVQSVVLQVVFDSMWDGYGKTAVFTTDKIKEPYEVALDTKGSCIIPHEVLANEGILYIGMRGIITSEETVTIKTSNLAKYKIVKGAARGKNTTLPPTPDIYATILNAANSAVTAAQEVKEDMVELKHDIKTDMEGLRSDMKVFCAADLSTTPITANILNFDFFVAKCTIEGETEGEEMTLMFSPVYKDSLNRDLYATACYPKVTIQTSGDFIIPTWSAGIHFYWSEEGFEYRAKTYPTGGGSIKNLIISALYGIKYQLRAATPDESLDSAVHSVFYRGDTGDLTFYTDITQATHGSTVTIKFDESAHYCNGVFDADGNKIPNQSRGNGYAVFTMPNEDVWLEFYHYSDYNPDLDGGGDDGDGDEGGSDPGGSGGNDTTLYAYIVKELEGGSVLDSGTAKAGDKVNILVGRYSSPMTIYGIVGEWVSTTNGNYYFTFTMPAESIEIKVDEGRPDVGTYSWAFCEEDNEVYSEASMYGDAEAGSIVNALGSYVKTKGITNPATQLKITGVSGKWVKIDGSWYYQFTMPADRTVGWISFTTAKPLTWRFVEEEDENYTDSSMTGTATTGQKVRALTSWVTSYGITNPTESVTITGVSGSWVKSGGVWGFEFTMPSSSFTAYITYNTPEHETTYTYNFWEQDENMPVAATGSAKEGDIVKVLNAWLRNMGIDNPIDYGITISGVEGEWVWLDGYHFQFTMPDHNVTGYIVM